MSWGLLQHKDTDRTKNLGGKEFETQITAYLFRGAKQKRDEVLKEEI